VGQADAFARLLEAIEDDGIRFMIVGMSAAIAQGVMGSTLDIDVWVDLPLRQYMRVQNLAMASGATPGANTVVYLDDGTPIKFVYTVTGLEDFAAEFRYSKKLTLRGKEVAVMDLKRIQKSKRAIGCDKDLLHIKLIADFLRCQRGVARS
jgi:hypothetical protein